MTEAEVRRIVLEILEERDRAIQADLLKALAESGLMEHPATDD